jgi:hypothetical protein
MKRAPKESLREGQSTEIGGQKALLGRATCPPLCHSELGSESEH